MFVTLGKLHTEFPISGNIPNYVIKKIQEHLRAII